MKIIEQELIEFDNTLSDCLNSRQNQISENIKNFIFSKSKRLRPKLIFLFTKALQATISSEIINLAVSTELIHNSTLIHDDIIDNAQTRRGKLSLNKQLGNNLSVLAGDYLLSISMQVLAKCKNIECIEIFSNSLKLMCEGEINQHYTIGELPTMEDYIEKSQKKTAELFKAALISASLLSNIETKIAENFATNFGIAFQIKDDLQNILQTDITKPTLSDIHNKIYTAPIILLDKDIKNLSEEELIKAVQTQEIKKQTIELVKEYATKAIASLDDIKDNQYKAELIAISEDLYKVI